MSTNTPTQKDAAAVGQASKRARATSRAKDKRAVDPERRRKLAIVLAVVAVVFIMLYRPTRDLYIAWRTGYSLESRYEALAQENEELNDDLERLMTREGIEDEARERGYVLPGETSVRVEGLEEDPEEAAAANEIPWYIHVGDAFFFFEANA